MSDFPSPAGQGWVDEIERVVSLVQQDRQRLSAELDAERRARAELQARVDALNAERVDFAQRATNDQVQIDRLKAAARDLEHRYEMALAQRDQRMGEMQRNLEAVNQEWQTRFDRLVDSHDREIRQLEDELAHSRNEVDTLLVELAAARSRMAAEDADHELLSDPNAMILVDGDPLAAMLWPGARPSVGRRELILLLQNHAETIGTNYDIVFRTTQGLDTERPPHPAVRLRVPHEGIPIEPALRRLVDAYAQERPVLIATNLSGFPQSVPLLRFAAHLGEQVSMARPAELEAGTPDELELLMRTDSPVHVDAY